MKNTTIALCALAALASVACSKRTGGNSEELRSKQISITSSVDGDKSGKASKAMLDGTTVIGDIHLLRKDGTNGANKIFTGVTPQIVSRAAGVGNIRFATSELYDINSTDPAYFMAYYPATTLGATVTPGASVTWTPKGDLDILVSDLHNAGTYTAQNNGGVGGINTPMVFRHVLSNLKIVLEAKIETDETLAEIQQLWGTIQKIEIEGMYPQYTFNYNGGGLMSVGGNTTTLELIKGDGYGDVAKNTPNSTDGVIGDTGNASVKFASMLVPNSATSYNLKVYSSINPGAPVAVIVGGGANPLAGGLQKGHTHMFTLKFGMNPKYIQVTTSTIPDWIAGGNADGTLPNPPVRP